MAMSKATCVACRHQIDAAARLCPYCGADPQTGQKMDTQAMVQEMFNPREMTTTEGVMQFARQRQGVVITAGIGIALLLMAALHQFAMRRNQTDVNSANAIPLTEITDLSNQQSETRQLPMPDLKFQYEGQPKTLRTFVIEPGAVTPPEVIAEQQAAAAAKAAAPPKPQ
jgi:hypothetical protein